MTCERIKNSGPKRFFPFTPQYAFLSFFFFFNQPYDFPLWFLGILSFKRCLILKLQCFIPEFELGMMSLDIWIFRAPCWFCYDLDGIFWFTWLVELHIWFIALFIIIFPFLFRLLLVFYWYWASKACRVLISARRPTQMSAHEEHSLRLKRGKEARA